MTMRHPHRAVLAYVTILVFVGLFLASLQGTTWAAPSAQGTVPTPPNPTAEPTAVQPTAEPGDGGDSGGDSGGDGGGGNGGQPTSPDAGGVPTSPTPGVAGTTTPVPFAAPSTLCPIGETGAQCEFQGILVGIGAGAVQAGSVLTIEAAFPQPPCPASPIGQAFLNRCYRFTWIGTDAQPLPQVPAPVQYCMNYSAAELSLARNDPTNLLVGFTANQGAWTVVKPVVDASASRVCATVNQAYTWAAMFTPTPTLLPVTGANVDWQAMAVLASLTALAVLALGLGVRRGLHR